MAKVTIEIEDLPGGKVAVRATPNFTTMMKMDASGAGLTAAHGYALALLNKAREVSKSNDPKINILIPRLKPGRMH